MKPITLLPALRAAHPTPRHLALAAALMLSTWAAAQPAAQPDCDLRIASGPSGKVYELVVRDIQAVCGTTVSVCSAPSEGGLKNVTMLSANEAELGLVQVDTLKEMSKGDENIRSLQAVMPLHANLLHIITASEGSLVGAKEFRGIRVPGTGEVVVLRKFSQLKGMTIAAVGSAQLMGQTLERELGYGMKMVVADTDDKALEMLRNGQVQAVFTLGGWPLPSVSRLKGGAGVQLADFDLEPREPYLTVKRNYQNLDAFNLTFLGVPNLLVSRPFKAGGAQANKVAALQSCIRRHLDDLQEGRFLSVWKEIKDPTRTFGVTAVPTSAKLVAK